MQTSKKCLLPHSEPVQSKSTMEQSFLLVLCLALCVACVSSYGGYGGYGGHGISAAIVSKHSIHAIPYGGDGGHGRTTHVNIHGGVAPIKMHFESKSSPIYMSHSHYNSGGSFGKSYSYDKPHKRVHVVHKPVYHELKEIISPYKHTYQIVHPVKHSYKTHIMSGHGYGHGHY